MQEDDRSPDPPGLAMRRQALAGWANAPHGRNVKLEHAAALHKLTEAEQEEIAQSAEKLWGRQRRSEWTRISRAVDRLSG